MAATAELTVLIRARDEASRAMGGIGGAAGRMGQAIRTGALLGGAAVVGIGVAAVKMAADFETAFAEVTTLFDAPKAQVDALRQGVLDLSSEMGVDATEATKALYQAISAGVDPNNAIDFLRENTRFAVAGVTDLNTAVDLSTTVMNAWGLESNELGRVHDVLFATVRAGKTTVAELGASMFQVAPAAAAAGVSVEGVGAALATLTAQGVPTAQAATSLRAALVELGKEGTKANIAFTDVAGEGFRDFIAGGGDMVSAMEIMQQAADDNGVAISDLFGAVEGGLAVQILAGEGFETLAANMDSIRGSSGLTQEAFEKMNETFGRQFTILKSQLKVAMIEIGSRILPLLTDALERLTPWLQENIPRAVAAFEDAMDQAKPFVEAFITGLRTILPPARALFSFIIENKPVLIAAIAAIGLAIIVAFGPVSIAVAAIVGLVLLIGWLRDNWDAIGGQIADIVGGIRDAVVGVFTEILDFLTDNWAEILSVAAIFLLGPAGLLLLFSTNAFGIRDMVFDVFNRIRDFFGEVLGEILGIFTDKLGQILAAVTDWITDTADAFAGFFTDLITDTIGFYADLLSDTVTGLANVLTAIGDWIRDTFNALGQWERDVLGLFTGMFGDIVGAAIGWAGDMGAWIGAALLDMKTKVDRPLGSIKDTFRNTFSELVSMGRDLGTNLANAITDAFKAAWNAVATFINNAIPNELTFAVPFGPDIHLDLPDNPLPLLAHGGIVTRPTLAVLGEAGPEAVIPLSDGLLPSQNITINVTVEDRSPAAIAHAVEMAGLELGERLALEGV